MIEYILRLKIEADESLQGVEAEQEQIFSGKKIGGVAAPITRETKLMPEPGAIHEATGHGLGVLHVLREGAGIEPNLGLQLQFIGVSSPGLEGGLELWI